MKKVILCFITICNVHIISAQNPKIIFRSGFEPNTEIIEHTYHLDNIVGGDLSYLPPNIWFPNFHNNSFINFSHINYGHGNQNQNIRKAEIKPDPDGNYPDNNVIHFWISEPYLNGSEVKGRVQISLEGNSVSKFSYSVRLYLPPNLTPLKNTNYSFDWFTLMEFWNNPNWDGSDYPFRIKLELTKSINTNVLRFRTRAQRHVVLPHTSGFSNVWSETNYNYDVPLGKWLTFQVYLEEGDATNGKYKVILTPDGEESFTLFDRTGFTHHPLDPNPNGFKTIQPMKLYTSEGLINYVNANNGLVNLFWDDFILCDDKGLDLHVRNSLDDFGEEPDVNEMFWNSPDIWVRNYADGEKTHQNPNYGTNPNHVYVRVNNKSCEPSTGNETLELRWAKADTGIDGAALWTGTATGGPNNIPLGGLVGTLNIPVIAPGDEAILQFTWNIPNPEDYFGITENDWHYCLLTRIITPNDPMTFPDYPWNSILNNNITSKNVTVVNTAVPPLVKYNPGGTVSIGNINGIVPGTFYFDFFTNEMDSSIFEEAEIKITLSESAFDRWIDGGSQARDIRLVNEEKRELKITGNNAHLKNMKYDSGEWDILYISFNFLTEKVTNKDIFEYHLIQRDALTNKASGGEVFQIIRNTERELFIAQGNSYENTSGETEMTAIDIGEPAAYNWYTPEGKLIHSGKEFTFIPEIPGDYLLEIIAETDGHKDYFNLTIVVNTIQDQIVTLSPNPASGMVEVQYQINSSATNASLNIVSFFGNLNTNHLIDLNNTESILCINLNGYPIGHYAVILKVDGVAVHAKQLIIK